MRRGKSNRGEQPGRIFQLGISASTLNATRVSSARSVHSRSRIFALDRRRMKLLFRCFSPMYHRTISPFHSISTFTSCDVSKLPFRRAKYSPQFQARWRRLPSSHSLGLTREILTDNKLLVYLTMLLQLMMVLQNPSRCSETSPATQVDLRLKLF